MEAKPKKKVLIITYYWPPAGGPGVQRWLKFVKYLGEFGIEPVVYVPENPSYPLTDEGMLKEIPRDVRILKRPIFEPYSLASVFSKKGTKTMSRGLIREKEQSLTEKWMLWIRGNLFIPDARKYWVTPSVKYLKKVIGEEGIEVVITTGPPHSLHLIGLKLKKNLKVKWIADFRDPWTSIGYHNKLKLGKRAARKHKELEKEVLTVADVVLATSSTTAMEFNEIAGREVEVITNGYDLSDLSGHPPAEKFCISHIGSLLTGRDPKILWEVLAEMAAVREDFKRDLHLKLVGAVSEDVLDSVRSAGLESFLEVQGYVSHTEALVLQKEARVLLLIEINSPLTRGIIPGKLFEYMASGRPVIAIGPEEWEAGSMVEDSKVGRVFTYNDKEALKTALTAMYEAYLRGQLQPENTAIEKYSRKNLTGKLAKIIMDL